MVKIHVPLIHICCMMMCVVCDYMVIHLAKSDMLTWLVSMTGGYAGQLKSDVVLFCCGKIVDFCNHTR